MGFRLDAVYAGFADDNMIDIESLTWDIVKDLILQRPELLLQILPNSFLPDAAEL